MRLPLLLAFLLAPATALAQQPGVPAPEVAQAQAEAPAGEPTVDEVRDIRVNQIFIYGDDTCPPSTDPNTINVCGRLDEAERFRVPENLRTDPNAPENQAWTNRAIELSYAGRSGIGSCSPTGPGGFIGCQQQLINQAVAERRGRPEVNWARLIEEARQERLGRIGQAAAEDETATLGNRRVQELRIQDGQECPPSTALVIIICHTPSGTPAPLQEPGEPQFPTTGVNPQPVQPSQTPQH